MVKNWNPQEALAETRAISGQDHSTVIIAIFINNSTKPRVLEKRTEYRVKKTHAACCQI
jgi:hypothetical protein